MRCAATRRCCLSAQGPCLTADRWRDTATGESKEVEIQNFCSLGPCQCSARCVGVWVCISNPNEFEHFQSHVFSVDSSAVLLVHGTKMQIPNAKRHPGTFLCELREKNH